jgi:cell wall-associated NlpC family hydrolase
VKRFISIFIMGISLYANKSGIGFYKDGKKIENIIQKENISENVMESRVDYQNNLRENILSFARIKLGSRYVWRATGPNTFDCSGFVQYVFNKSVGIALPRVSSDQGNYKPRISLMSMKKGDLIFFETTGKGRISHVDIWVKNNLFMLLLVGRELWFPAWIQIII